MLGKKLERFTVETGLLAKPSLPALPGRETCDGSYAQGEKNGVRNRKPDSGEEEGNGSLLILLAAPEISWSPCRPALIRQPTHRHSLAWLRRQSIAKRDDNGRDRYRCPPPACLPVRLYFPKKLCQNLGSPKRDLLSFRDFEGFLAHPASFPAW